MLALPGRSLEIRRRHKISFRDSLIAAATWARGCETPGSEDMDDGRIVEGVRVANPSR